MNEPLGHVGGADVVNVFPLCVGKGRSTSLSYLLGRRAAEFMHGVGRNG